VQLAVAILPVMHCVSGAMRFDFQYDCIVNQCIVNSIADVRLPATSVPSDL